MARTAASRPVSPAYPALRANLLRASRVVGAALLLAVSAKIQFPVPGSPVPATLQLLAVLLAGGLLGPRSGAAAVGTYLAAGLAGAPVFATLVGPAALAGPTGGYLLGFLPAVVLAGLVARKGGGLLALFGGFLLAGMVVFLAGWAQLSVLAGPSAAFRAGVLPFIPWDILKALLAAAIVRRARARREGSIPEGNA